VSARCARPGSRAAASASASASARARRQTQAAALELEHDAIDARADTRRCSSSSTSAATTSSELVKLSEGIRLAHGRRRLESWSLSAPRARMRALEKPRSGTPACRLPRVRVLRDTSKQTRLARRVRERSLELRRKLRELRDELSRRHEVTHDATLGEPRVQRALRHPDALRDDCDRRTVCELTLDLLANLRRQKRRTRHKRQCSSCVFALENAARFSSRRRSPPGSEGGWGGGAGPGLPMPAVNR
jgi:hypothetical protein